MATPRMGNVKHTAIALIVSVLIIIGIGFWIEGKNKPIDTSLSTVGDIEAPLSPEELAVNNPAITNTMNGDRRHPPARARADRDARLGRSCPAASPAADLPAPGAPAEPRRAARHAARDGRPRRPGPGGRPRVRRHCAAFVPGDRAAHQSTGGRAPAAAELIVNERHPERNADVVLFLDTLRRGARRLRRRTARSSCAVRAAATLATAVPRAPRPRRARHASAASSAGSSPASGLVQRYRLDRRAARDRASSSATRGRTST